MESPSSKVQKSKALNFRTALACMVGLLLVSIAVQYTEILVGMNAPAEQALPFPALVILVLSITVSALFSKFGLRFLTKAEQLCVFYVLIMATPLMTQGFWHRVVGITATIPRGGDYAKIEALSPQLWPHGRNLFETKTVELQNSSPETAKETFITVSATDIGEDFGDTYLFTTQVIATNLGPESEFYVQCSATADGKYRTDLLRSRASSKSNDSGTPLGKYNWKLPEETVDDVTLIFGLHGRGQVQFTDNQWYSVEALETLFTGRQLIDRTSYEQLSPAERSGLVVQPDSWLSVEGIKMLLTGYIPVRDWLRPLFFWTSFLGLILGGTFVLNLFMRKRWMESERFAMPLSRVPLKLIGVDLNPGECLIWRTPVMWAGFGIGLSWCLLKGWGFYSANLPDFAIDIPLQPYFGPDWGKMWNGVTLSVFLAILSLAIFLDTSVLLSLVVGYFGFRALFWIGPMIGFSTDPIFISTAYRNEQQIGSFLAYGFVTIALAKPYLTNILKQIRRGGGDSSTYRSALIGTGVLFLASLAWAAANGFSISGFLIFVGLLIMIGFVSAKLRAECGLIFGYFAPANAAALIMALGGISTFGSELTLFAVITSFFITVSVFYLIPGAQLELLEHGHRAKISPASVFGFCVIAMIGGVVIGGWTFLSNSYSLGGASLPYRWAFDPKTWYFASYNANVVAAESGTGGLTGVEIGAYAYGGTGAVVLSALRRLFTSFWFHPIGFLLGPSYMMDTIWGSALLAWVIRRSTVQIGGSKAVREKLYPFFIGTLLACVTAYVIWSIVGGYLRSRGVDLIYTDMP